jgi:hypothetical protein
MQYIYTVRVSQSYNFTMSSKLDRITARFIKEDKYHNFIFLVDSQVETLGYKKAKRLSKAMSGFESNPVWIQRDKKFATLRFKKPTYKCKQLATYDITFNCYQTQKNDLKYANMVVEEIKFIKSKDNGLLIETVDDVVDDLSE